MALIKGKRLNKYIHISIFICATFTICYILCFHDYVHVGGLGLFRDIRYLIIDKKYDSLYGYLY